MSRKPGQHKPRLTERLMNELQPSAREKARLLETGVGRAALHGWGRNFAEAFRYVMPPSVTLRMRPEPGITYLSGQELMQTQDYVVKRNIEGRVDVYESIRALVARLCSEQVLEYSTATRQRPVKFNGIKLRLIKPNRQHIIARVKDVPSEFYGGGFLLAGERAAVIETMMETAQSEAEDQESRLQDVVLGTVEASDGNFRTDLLGELKGLLEPRITLSRVGSVKFSYPHASADENR